MLESVFNLNIIKLPYKTYDYFVIVMNREA